MRHKRKANLTVLGPPLVQELQVLSDELGIRGLSRGRKVRLDGGRGQASMGVFVRVCVCVCV